MNKLLKIIYFPAIASSLYACTAVEETPVWHSSDRGRVTISCRAGDEDAKSEYAGEDPDSPVRQVHFMAYTSGRLDAEYSGSGSKAELKLYEDKVYDIYALVNTESDEFTAPEYESELPYIGIDASTAGLTRRGGIPMAGKSSIRVTKDAAVRITCRRLFARYRISLAGTGAEYFEASAVGITGVPHIILPFGTNQATSVTDGDNATTKDLLNFNSGREIVFHIPENIQGSERGPLCTGVHISGRICGYEGGGNAVFGFDRKVSYDYLLKDANGDYNVDGNSDYTSTLQLSRYGWTLSDEQATLEEGSEKMHYLFFCDSSGKPVNSVDVKAGSSSSTVRIYYRTDCENVIISSDKDTAEESLALRNVAIHCGEDIYCNEYSNAYMERRNDSHICFSAGYTDDELGFELHATVNYRFEGIMRDFSIVCDKDPDNLYIAQIAGLTVNGGEDSQWQWSVDRPEAVVLIPDGSSCRMECHGAGKVVITAINGYEQTVTRKITIWKPAVAFTRSSMSLPLNGTGVDIPFRLMDRHGNVMNDNLFDIRLKNLLLIPQFVLNHADSSRPFAGLDDRQLYVSTLKVAGTVITALDSGDGSVHLGQLTHPENITLANSGQYCIQSESLEVYTIVPENDLDREYEMFNYYHIGGAVSDCCPEEICIPNATDFGIEITSELEAEVEVDGDYVWIRWPMDRNLCGRYDLEMYCRNDRDGSSIRLCNVGIDAYMYLGIKMVSIEREGLWWLAPVSCDNSSVLFPKNREYVTWNRDSEFIDNVEIITSERKWGLHQNQIDGGLCVSRCEKYFGGISPAFSDGTTIDASKYFFVSDDESRPLSDAYEINVNAIDNPYLKIIDMTR